MTRIKLSFANSPGIMPDPYDQDVLPNAFSRAVNARFGDKGAQSFSGHTKIFDTKDAAAAAFTATWIKFFPDRTRPRWVYANNNKVFCYENFIISEITRVSGGDYGATERWQGAVFNGIGVLNDGFDIPQVWTPIDDGTKLINLANWPTNYRVRFIKPFKEFLVAGHVYDGTNLLPNRLIWSNRADPGTIPPDWAFTDPASDAGRRDLQKSDALIDGLDMVEQFIIYREKSTWAAQLSGDENIMRTYEISDSVGLLWKDCVAAVPRGHVLATWDDLVFHQGNAASFRSLLDPGRRKWINNTRDQTYYKNSFIVLDHPEKEIWFCFPQLGFEYANVAATVNWENGKVGVRDLPSVPFADSGPVILAG